MCQEKFEGTAGGIFLKPIEKQKLKITEEEFDKFVKEKYGNYVYISGLRINASLNIKHDNKFDTTQFKNIKNIHKYDNDAYLFNFDNAPSIALMKKDNMYKIAIDSDHHMKYTSDRNYMNIVTIIRLKNNILRYHMKEAELLDYDKETLDEKITEAIAPIVALVKKDQVSGFIKKHKKRDLKEVHDFYLHLNNEEDIVNKINEMH